MKIRWHELRRGVNRPKLSACEAREAFAAGFGHERANGAFPYGPWSPFLTQSVPLVTSKRLDLVSKVEQDGEDLASCVLPRIGASRRARNVFRLRDKTNLPPL